MVHDYQTSPQFSYLQSRITHLGQAANSQNRTVSLVVIFSAEPIYMYNTFQDAYQDILNQFNSVSFHFQANVQLIGYQIYSYTDASATRP